MAESVAHVPVPYPTPEDGLHSGSHVASHFLGGATLNRAELVAHGWVGVGSVLAQVFPLAVQAEATGEIVLTDEQKQTLAEMKKEFEADPKLAGIDPERLKRWAKLLLTILMMFL